VAREHGRELIWSGPSRARPSRARLKPRPNHDARPSTTLLDPRADFLEFQHGVQIVRMRDEEMGRENLGDDGARDWIVRMSTNHRRPANARFQPPRRLILPAAVGCKSLLGDRSRCFKVDYFAFYESRAVEPAHFCTPDFAAGAAWMPRKPPRSMARCSSPDTLASSTNSLK
jgi:hypothetical protein